MILPPPIARENNPLYPLPPDYASLSADGQRQARVAALRQWLLKSPPLLPGESLAKARGEILVASTWFFDSYYLMPETNPADPDSDFDPGFYDQPPLPTPSLHWDLSRSWASFDLNVAMAPRGSAKTTHMRKDMLLRLASCPRYSIAYATSTHDNAVATGDAVRDQLYYNARLNDDFTPEYDAPLKPPRGRKNSGVEYFALMNGSWLRCLSAESRIRSLRPRRFRLDDPEYDEKASTSMATLRGYMEKLLFNLVIPMVNRAGCGVDWVGTFVSKRHYLYHAMQTIETPQGLRASDPRFDFWSRLLIDMYYEDPSTGALTSCWPHMWPVDAAERTRLNLDPSTKTIEEIRLRMGSSSFNAEMRGMPGTSDEQFFKLDPNPKGRHAYWFEDMDPALATDPFASTTLLCYLDPTGTLVKVPLGTFLRTSRTFLTVDTAYTEKTHSDRRCAMLMAITHSNELFVLDLWSDRKPDSVLVNKSLAMCALWKCPILFVEVVKESIKLYNRYRSTVRTRLTSELGVSFVPAIKDLRPGTMTKTAKIEGLDTRFEYGLVKLPLFKKHMAPAWNRLFEQIEGFNPEAENGGLQHDDELDCLSMSFIAIKSRLRRQTPDKPPPLNPIAELKAGRRNLPGTDVPIASGLPLQLLSNDDLEALLAPPDPKSQTTTRI